MCSTRLPPSFIPKKMRKSLKHFPLGICREDFDTEEDYQYAIEHYWDLYNMAEDMAMEEHYEKKYKNS